MNGLACQVGDVILANIHNAREAGVANGKWRPAVVVQILPSGDLRLAGLTTNSHHADGTRRRRFYGRWVGLDKNGYLWGGSLVTIKPADAGLRLGRCYREMAVDIVEITAPRSLHDWTARAFIDACQPAGIGVDDDQADDAGEVDCSCELCDEQFRQPADGRHTACLACRVVLGHPIR